MSEVSAELRRLSELLGEASKCLARLSEHFEAPVQVAVPAPPVMPLEAPVPIAAASSAEPLVGIERFDWDAILPVARQLLEDDPARRWRPGELCRAIRDRGFTFENMQGMHWGLLSRLRQANAIVQENGWVRAASPAEEKPAWPWEQVVDRAIQILTADPERRWRHAELARAVRDSGITLQGLQGMHFGLIARLRALGAVAESDGLVYARPLGPTSGPVALAPLEEPIPVEAESDFERGVAGSPEDEPLPVPEAPRAGLVALPPLLAALAAAPVRSTPELDPLAAAPDRSTPELDPPAAAPVRSAPELDPVAEEPIRSMPGLDAVAAAPARSTPGLDARAAAPVRSTPGLDPLVTEPVVAAPATGAIPAPPPAPEPLPVVETFDAVLTALREEIDSAEPYLDMLERDQRTAQVSVWAGRARQLQDETEEGGDAFSEAGRILHRTFGILTRITRERGCGWIDALARTWSTDWRVYIEWHEAAVSGHPPELSEDEVEALWRDLVTGLSTSSRVVNPAGAYEVIAEALEYLEPDDPALVSVAKRFGHSLPSRPSGARKAGSSQRPARVEQAQVRAEIPPEVLALTRGLRGLILGGQGAREEQRMKLERELGLAQLDWAHHERSQASQYQRYSERIRGRSYDLVFFLAAFSSHKSAAFLRECKAQGVPIVYLNRGYGLNQVVECLRTQLSPTSIATLHGAAQSARSTGTAG